MKKSGLGVALTLVYGMSVPVSHAAVLNPGDLLTITEGMPIYDSNGYFVNVTIGSWFSMDMNGDSKIAGTEKPRSTWAPRAS